MQRFKDFTRKQSSLSAKVPKDNRLVTVFMLACVCVCVCVCVCMFVGACVVQARR